jgi:CHAT domain-containing protein
MDEEGWGSIAAALLEAGTAAVVATDRNVDDDATLAMMSAFYAQRDWQTDPARALARVQQKLDNPAATADDPAAASWAAFSVLGRPPVVTATAGD